MHERADLYVVDAFANSVGIDRYVKWQGRDLFGKDLLELVVELKARFGIDGDACLFDDLAHVAVVESCIVLAGFDLFLMPEGIGIWISGHSQVNEDGVKVSSLQSLAHFCW